MIENKRKKLVLFSQELANVTNLTDGLKCISQNAKTIMESERCSIFLYDQKHNELWTPLADGSERITISSDVGIIGRTLQLKCGITENDPYDNPNFLADVDMETGYYTRNLITAPIFDSKGKVMGVLELLNKKNGYNKDDTSFIQFLAHYVSGFIELYMTR